MIVNQSQIGWLSKRPVSRMLISLVCLCLWASHAIAAENPQAVVKTGTDKVLQLLKQYPENTQVRREKIRAAVNEYFDFEEIARRALGRPWKEQPPEKQQEFTRYFSQLLFNTYIGRVEKYTNPKITYNQKRREGDYAVIEALVVAGQSGTITIDYYLRLEDGDWKVYDVVIEGMGLVINYRDQFNAILSRSSFDDLLRQLKEKIAQS
ncbi:MAG: ABC transporter substrate-binding protein [Syntrophobacteraceae bacterium]